jgi:hypothetical protein
MSHYDTSSLCLLKFRSASELLALWPDTVKVHVPFENAANALGIRHEAFFWDHTSAYFDVEMEAMLERGMYLAHFRYLGRTPIVRVWKRVIPAEDWYGGPQYQWRKEDSK